MGNHKVLKTSAGGNSHYSMYEFIDAIKDLRILWDRQHVDFNSRELRDKAWHLVGKKLCRNYDDASEEEQNDIAKTLLKRWKNTRDSFFRVLRLRYVEQDRFRPSYIYEKELAFLVEGNKELEMLAAFSSTATSKRGSKNHSFKTEKHTHEGILSTSTLTNKAKSLSRQNVNTDKTISTRSSTAAAAITAAASKSLAKTPTKHALRRNASESTMMKSVKKRRLSEKSDYVNDNQDSENSILEAKFTELEEVERSSNHGHEELLRETCLGVNESNPDDGGPETPQAKKFDSSYDILKSAPVEQSGIAVNNATAPVVPTDPDQAFFESIKPHMQQMSKDQKLDFQIEVLKLLRNF